MDTAVVRTRASLFYLLRLCVDKIKTCAQIEDRCCTRMIQTRRDKPYVNVLSRMRHLIVAAQLALCTFFMMSGQPGERA